jgi:hypothetical protein
MKTFIWGVILGFATFLPAGAAEEQVRLQVPGSVVFPVTDLHSRAAALPTLVSFDQALLAPGSRLRISVRAEGLDLGAGAPARISYAARGRGGIAFSASLRDTDFTPVFESDPLALSGSVEIAWILEPLGHFDRAGNRGVTLRWRVESIAGPAGRPEAGRSPRAPAARPAPAAPADAAQRLRARPLTDTSRKPTSPGSA